MSDPVSDPVTDPASPAARTHERGRLSLAPLAGSIAEAWSELRVHKLRVLLSLIGIAVAVAALTAVLAIGEYQRQLTIEQSDRSGGRVATLGISASTTTGTPVDGEAMDARFDRVAERYNFSRTTRVADGAQLPVQLTQGVMQLPARLVDPDYGVMHRLQTIEGRYFVAGDEQLMAPAVVISEALWDMIGRTPMAQHPTLTMTGNFAGTYRVIGVLPREGVWDTTPRVDMLYDAYFDRIGVLSENTFVVREVWVPPEMVSELAPMLAADLRAGLPADTTISVDRRDWASLPGTAEANLVFQLVSGAIAFIVLLLGGLGLVNIQLVAMRQRIREIGVRRSFGASSARIFTSVLLESVVATTVAGLVGILIVVLAARLPLITETVFAGIQDIPPFPFTAALAGLLASVFVGALAGLLPALTALRVKVIDAIRY